jgi:hypothetical protein
VESTHKLRMQRDLITDFGMQKRVDRRPLRAVREQSMFVGPMGLGIKNRRADQDHQILTGTDWLVSDRSLLGREGVTSSRHTSLFVKEEDPFRKA